MRDGRRTLCYATEVRGSSAAYSAETVGTEEVRSGVQDIGKNVTKTIPYRHIDKGVHFN